MIYFFTDEGSSLSLSSLILYIYTCETSDISVLLYMLLFIIDKNLQFSAINSFEFFMLTFLLLLFYLV